MAGFVRRGEQYLESLRDGREVWYGGEKIRDVTEHPLTAPAIRTLAKIYDQQHDPSLVDVMTSFRADGARIATSWLAPRTPAELARKRKDLEQRCWASYGSFLGRQPGIVSWNLIGMNAHIGIFKQYCAEYADNLPAYLKQAQEQDLYLVGASVEPQGHRSRSAKAGENRSAILQVTKRSEKGIWLTGAKAVATGAPQANDILIGSVNYPHVLPDESFWVSVPVASPGLKLVCREASVWPSGAGHPIAAMGEEADAFLVLDNVFVPKDRIFALDEPELCDGSIFQRAARGESWAALIRLAVRAEFLVGVAQMVVEALDTVELPLVRESVGRIIEFSQVLRAGVIAAETMATPAEDGTLLPETALTAACRAYALENYPRVIQVLHVPGLRAGKLPTRHPGPSGALRPGNGDALSPRRSGEPRDRSAPVAVPRCRAGLREGEEPADGAGLGHGDEPHGDPFAGVRKPTGLRPLSTDDVVRGGGSHRGRGSNPRHVGAQAEAPAGPSRGAPKSHRLVVETKACSCTGWSRVPRSRVRVPPRWWQATAV
jgi:4-hydroxyphenylacetate 3-monooxygenase